MPKTSEPPRRVGPIRIAVANGGTSHIKTFDVDYVANLLSHRYRRPESIQRVKALAKTALSDAFVAESSERSQEHGEFERASTTVVDAYVGPHVSGCLGQLEPHPSSQGSGGDFFVIQAKGGSSRAPMQSLAAFGCRKRGQRRGKSALKRFVRS